jgi:hypothetical protein
MTFASGVLCAALLALAGCGETTRINQTAGGGGLTGQWAPDGGGYTAEFQNGAFRTVATDTGNVISSGSYVAVSGNSVELSWTSNITGQANSAKCERPTANELACTDAGGKPFTLRRVAG